MHPVPVSESNGIALLDNGAVFSAVRLSPIDTELDPIEERERSLLNVLKNLKPDHTARFWLRSKIGAGVSPADSRAEALSEVWFVENDLTLIIEREASASTHLLREMLSAFRLREKGGDGYHRDLDFDITALELAGIRTRALDPSELNALFPRPIARISSFRTGLDYGHAVVGCVRMVKQSATAIPLTLLSDLKDQLPLPYEIRTSVRRVPRVKAESFLRRRVGQVSQSTSSQGAAVHADSESHLDDVALSGASLFEVEFLILLERGCEADLREAARDVVQTLKPLGDFALETVGAVPSLMASYIGNKPHLTFLESEDAFATLLPVFSRGSQLSNPSEHREGGLTTHRRDQTLESVNVFDNAYDNYSACIFGKSGRGKSVLTNLLTRALLSDPNIHITKVDVGGSHSKETKLLGGVEHKFSISTPSGLDVFAVARHAASEERGRESVSHIISGFVGTLLLEEGETFLPKQMKSEIEDAVLAYLSSRPSDPSITDFYKHAKSLPRRDLLRRWCSTGTFKNAFAPSAGEASSEKERSERTRESRQNFRAASAGGSLEEVLPASSTSRLTYYNFSELSQAGDADYAEGVMAAVVAQFNLELLADKNTRRVFIVDEAPFFIQRCFAFFKFSTANVRKFGGSFIVIAQKSTDVIVGGDTGLLDNTALKFLFSIDGERGDFAKRMKFTEGEMERLESLESVKGEFSELLFQDARGSRILRLALAKREYWSATSSQADNKRLNEIMAAVPGLKLEQAIHALACSRHASTSLR